MKFSDCNLSVFIILLLFFWSSIVRTNEHLDAASLTVEHAFDDGVANRFSVKGSIQIRSISSNIAQFSGEKALTSEERLQFEKLIESDGLYRVRIPIRTEKGDEYVESSIRACLIAASNWHLTLTISVDGWGNVVCVHVSTAHTRCFPSQGPGLASEATATAQSAPAALPDPLALATSVQVQSPVAGAGPETQEYLKKLERQREEKARAEEGDNRSFFSKYWYYIIPFVLILMVMSNAPDANASGGGSGGR